MKKRITPTNLYKVCVSILLIHTEDTSVSMFPRSYIRSSDEHCHSCTFLLAKISLHRETGSKICILMISPNKQSDNTFQERAQQLANSEKCDKLCAFVLEKFKS